MVASRANYNELIDVYAFGIMLSEMLTWRLAYSDKGYENVFVFRDAVTRDGVRPTLDLDDSDAIALELGTAPLLCHHSRGSDVVVSFVCGVTQPR